MNRLLSINDVADLLQVPVATLYAWRSRQQGPPSFRVVGHVRYDPDQLEQWIREQRNADPGAGASDSRNAQRKENHTQVTAAHLRIATLK